MSRSSEGRPAESSGCWRTFLVAFQGFGPIIWAIGLEWNLHSTRWSLPRLPTLETAAVWVGNGLRECDGSIPVHRLFSSFAFFLLLGGKRCFVQGLDPVLH